MFKIYIEIKINKILIAQLKEQKDQYALFAIEKTLLNNLEFNEDKLFNLSKLFEIIKNYLIKHNSEKSNVIVCINPTLEKDGKLLTTKLFQITLAISKTGLKIEKIIASSILRKKDKISNTDLLENNLMFINKKELNNQLDFFNKFRIPKQKSPNKWLTITLILLVSQTYFFNKSYQSKQTKLKNIKKEVHRLNVKLEPLKDEILKTNQTRSQKLLIENKIQKYNSGINKNNKISEILTKISKQIPRDCRLTNLIIKSKKTGVKAKKRTIISMTGESFKQEFILNFAKNLKTIQMLRKTKLINIQKANNNDKISKYNFKLKSIIKNI